MKRPAVFLDRDNTIIHNDGDLGDPDAVELIQGAAAAIASICGLGYRVVVITNQGGVARGNYDEADVDAVHDRIAELITAKTTGAHIDAFYFCPFHPQGTVKQYTREHPDRKPAPGMILRAAEDHDLDLALSWTVGDAVRDCEAGHAAGTRTILVDPNHTGVSASADTSPPPNKSVDYRVSSLIEAVRIIAQARKPDSPDEQARYDKARMAALQQPRDPDKTGQTYKPPKPIEFRPNALREGEDDDEPIAKRIKRKQQEQRRAEREAKLAAEAAEREAERVAGDAPASPSDNDTENDTPPTRKKVLRRKRDPHAEPERSEDSDTEHHTDPTHDLYDDEDDDLPTPTHPVSRTDHLLRQLLHETRQARQPADLGPLQMFAIGLQTVTLVCLMGAWVMQGETAVLWLGTGITAQLAVIALLLFNRR